jgi:hypothetical protein
MPSQTKNPKSKSLTEVTLPDGSKAEVRRLTSCSAYVVPYTTRRDKRTGKRRRFYEKGYHISPAYVEESREK